MHCTFALSPTRTPRTQAGKHVQMVSYSIPRLIRGRSREKISSGRLICAAVAAAAVVVAVAPPETKLVTRRQSGRRTDGEKSSHATIIIIIILQSPLHFRFSEEGCRRLVRDLPFSAGNLEWTSKIPHARGTRISSFIAATRVAGRREAGMKARNPSRPPDFVSEIHDGGGAARRGGGTILSEAHHKAKDAPSLP